MSMTLTTMFLGMSKRMSKRAIDKARSALKEQITEHEVKIMQLKEQISKLDDRKKVILDQDWVMVDRDSWSHYYNGPFSELKEFLHHNSLLFRKGKEFWIGADGLLYLEETGTYPYAGRRDKLTIYLTRSEGA